MTRFDLFRAVSQSFRLFQKGGGEQRRGHVLRRKKRSPPEKLDECIFRAPPREDSWEARAARRRDPWGIRGELRRDSWITFAARGGARDGARDVAQGGPRREPRGTREGFHCKGRGPVFQMPVEKHVARCSLGAGRNDAIWSAVHVSFSTLAGVL